MKRIVSLFLVVSILFSCLPFSSLAEGNCVSGGTHSFDGAVVGLDCTVWDVPIKLTGTLCSGCGLVALWEFRFWGAGFQFEGPAQLTPAGAIVYIAQLLMSRGFSAEDVPTPPAGYTSPGVPNYDNSGNLQLVVYPEYFYIEGNYGGPGLQSQYLCPSTFSASSGQGTLQCSGLDFTIRGSSTKNDYFTIKTKYSFTAPVTGLYLVNSKQTYSSGSYYSNGAKGSRSVDVLAVNTRLYAGNTSAIPVSDTYAYIQSDVEGRPNIPTTYSFSYFPLVLTVYPDSPSVTQKTSITINNTTYTGNIYVDASADLTYIYQDNSTQPIIINNYGDTITYNEGDNNYYITINPDADRPEPTPTPSPTPSPTPGPSTVPVGTGDTFSDDVVSGTSISGTVNAKAGDFVLATVSARSALTIPDTMTYLYKGSVFAGNSHNQTMSFAYQQVPEDGTYTYTFSQASAERMYLSLIVLSDVERLQYSGKYHTEGTGTSPYSVPDKAAGEMLVWGCSSNFWSPSDSSNSISWTASPSDLTYVGGASNSGQSRQANFIDDSSGAVSHSFSFDIPGYVPPYVIDAVEIIPKTVEPSPTPTPLPDQPSSGPSWWDKLLEKLGDTVLDGLLGALSALLGLILKLISTVLGWLIWAASQLLVLFPFLPSGVGALLVGGVVVCFVIGIIRFFRG